jgi:hypothetical protein
MVSSPTGTTRWRPTSAPSSRRRTRSSSAGQRHRAVRDVHQRGREVRRHLNTARSKVGQYDCGRRRTGRVRAGSEEPTRSRYRRSCKHLGRPGTTCRGRRRRAQAGDRTDDRGPRTETPRRLAGDSARVDPKHDLTDWLSARRLLRHRVGEQRHLPHGRRTRRRDQSWCWARRCPASRRLVRMRRHRRWPMNQISTTSNPTIGSCHESVFGSSSTQSCCRVP